MPFKPWRTVAAPHPDVAAGRYRKDEYMADLGAVVSGEAETEYRDPVDFYRRTFVTAGIRELLSSVIGRLQTGDGDPVVQLKTAFGGGKTHSMLALYHLVSAPDRIVRQGLAPQGLGAVSLDQLPRVRVAVLACASLDPNKPRPHRGLAGQPVRTLWGDVAAQLGGSDGYALVREADERGIAPGGDTLAALLRASSPCLILIDEFVAYVRNMYRAPIPPPGGSFDSNMTFVQALTEAVKRVPNAALVASLPVSKPELGGEGGQAALERVEPIFGRVEAVWRPVGVEESFEVVRRRLFSEVTDATARDATCQAFLRLYQRHRDAFPPEASERRYLERLQGAYPLHPEVFDRLYNDWSTLDGFQRTRGVLRLMAAVVHSLWAANDTAPLILPGSLPLAEDAVRGELTKPLPETENWNTVVETDVDGPRSAAFRLDTQYQRFGKILAARRLARSIFLQTAPASAPGAEGSGRVIRGVEEPRLRLGVVQPDESLGLFHDALDQLQQNETTYLHRSTGEGGQAGDRFWFDLRQSLDRLMQARARDLQRDGDEPAREIARRLRDQVTEAQRNGGKRVFAAVHVVAEHRDALEASRQVLDEDAVRLVVLGPAFGYREGGGSQAESAARTVLAQRGDEPRRYQNLVLFLTPHQTESENLIRQAARFLAWASIERDAKQLNLDAYQVDEAQRSRAAQDKALNQALDGAYRNLLVPAQAVTEEADGPKAGALRLDAVPTTPVEGNVIQGAARRAEGDEAVRRALAPELLIPELARWFWRERRDVEMAHLWDCLARYSYLPRLRDADVLRATVGAGVQTGLFAYAQGRQEQGQYDGVAFRQTVTWPEGRLTGWLVDPRALPAPEPSGQEEAHEAKPEPWGAGIDTGPRSPAPGGSIAAPPARTAVEVVVSGSWSGSEVQRLGHHVSRAQDEVLTELLSALGAVAQAELRVTVTAPEGIKTDNLKVAIENARAVGVRIEVR